MLQKGISLNCRKKDFQAAMVLSPGERMESKIQKNDEVKLYSQFLLAVILRLMYQLSVCYYDNLIFITMWLSCPSHCSPMSTSHTHACLCKEHSLYAILLQYMDSALSYYLFSGYYYCFAF